LSNFDNSIEFEEIGNVLQVGDGIARIYGLNNVESNEMIVFSNGVTGIVMNLEEDM
jgi:F-type H+-transporting ATPase subunit alpha